MYTFYFITLNHVKFGGKRFISNVFIIIYYYKMYNIIEC